MMMMMMTNGEDFSFDRSGEKYEKQRQRTFGSLDRPDFVDGRSSDLDADIRTARGRRDGVVTR